MFKIHLTQADLIETRFAFSPLWEIVTSYRVLKDPARHALYLPWLKEAQTALADVDLSYLDILIRRHGYFPDFLTPPPACPSPTFDQEIARIREYDTEDVKADVEFVYRDQEAGQDFQDTVVPFIESVKGTFHVVNYELSNLPPDDFEMKYASVTDWYIRPGNFGAFWEGLGQVAGTLKEAGWSEYWVIVSTAAGDRGNNVELVLLYDSFADMQEPEVTFMDVLAEKLGAEETKELMDNWGPTFAEGDNNIYMLRQDLSY